MPHIYGHIPNGTLYINDRREGQEYYVHGYLFVAEKVGKEYVPDESIRILFMNNSLIDLPGIVKPHPGGKPGSLKEMDPTEVKKRMVGFHLLLIDMPKTKDGEPSKWGIAVNLAKVEDHESTEESLQTLNRFKGKRVEDIDPDEIIHISDLVKNDSGDGKAINKARAALGNTSKDTAALILKQSGEYMKTNSFKLSRAGDNPHTWIKSNVVKFEDMALLFGQYKSPNSPLEVKQ